MLVGLVVVLLKLMDAISGSSRTTDEIEVEVCLAGRPRAVGVSLAWTGCTARDWGKHSVFRIDDIDDFRRLDLVTDQPAALLVVCCSSALAIIRDNSHNLSCL